ncbi:MAG: 2Fe-2S iron-sulfur cluster-binding protein, partial [Planctomycetota bacterium]
FERAMPKISIGNQVISCQVGENLRRVLLSNDVSPHNGQSCWFNCKGFGTCGTCAIEIEGELAPLNLKEKLRLSFPPHRLENGLRLACQISVQTDLRIIKHDGFWGSQIRSES